MQFTTLITLTIATSMAALSVWAAPTPACGTICPTVYQPVCAKAIDGLNKVFGNACELKNYNCKHPNANFAVARTGLNKSFVNPCELKNYNCKHPNANFTAVANSDCADLVAVEKREAATAAPTCGTICPTVYQPVCARAIDGLEKAFGNACELKNYNCKHPNANFTVVANTNCKDIPAPAPVCNKACPKIYKPVCAKLQSGESKTFGNACEMNVFNCEHPNEKAQLVANAECSATPAACPTACAEIYKPVCAKLLSGESKTFGNACEMNVFNCAHPNEKAQLVANDACPAAPTACPTACAEIYKPVCAKYINGDLQTFANKCEMNIFNCKNPAIAFTTVVEGACDN
ncbi:hypothetical protein BGX24_010554 [Mortierella sp. AD032]|nr:hypothetical protein BGX24_010554 [Mortierella sp. AD032]